jgi:hypothetical protein
MDSPAASLYDDIALIDEALAPFTGPEVNERSGLRWMERTLTERRAHIMRNIAEAERSTLTVRVRTATGAPWVPVATVTALLDALQQALLAAGDEVSWPEVLGDDQRRAALTFEPGHADVDDEWWQIALHRPAGPLRAQPLSNDGDRLAVDAAMVAMLGALAEDAGDLGRIAVTAGLTVEVVAAPVSADPCELTIDRHTARTGG